jgi:2-keto-4-pentenoate hydratase/2-oxohepta-3-ene-1,7-dioic acid hydratase in catechol pathway
LFERQYEREHSITPAGPPGTVILTGTPHGVGMAAKPPRWLGAGDTVAVEIEGIGTLANPVRDSAFPIEM